MASHVAPRPAPLPAAGTSRRGRPLPALGLAPPRRHLLPGWSGAAGEGSVRASIAIGPGPR